MKSHECSKRVERVSDISAITISGVINDATVSEIEYMTERLSESDSFIGGLSHKEKWRLDIYDLAEMLISIAFTSSLVAYRRCEMWRYDFASEGSESGARIVAALDDLRARLIELQPSFHAYVKWKHARVAMRRALSICVLALDATNEHTHEIAVCFAGIKISSNDAQGDAQLRAEDHFGTDDTPAYDFSELYGARKGKRK